MLKIDEVVEGKSYACKFRTNTLLDPAGNPIKEITTNGGDQFAEYVSFGIIQQRDLTNNLVKLLDETSKIEFIVPFDNIWDIDEIEWIDS